MKFLDREGLFRGTAVEWRIKTLPSGDPIVSVSFEVDAVRDGDDWTILPEKRSVGGDFFVVKKTGAPNDKIVEMLASQLGWGGLFSEVVGSPPIKGPFALEVQGRDYKGKTYFSVNWVKSAEAKVAPPVNVDDLDKRFADVRKVASKSKAAPTEDIPF